MSGRKTIDLDTREYERLLKDRSRLSQIRSDLPQLLEASRQQSIRDAERMIHDVRQRQERLDQVIGDLTSEVATLASDMQQSLERQRAALTSLIAHVDSKVEAYREESALALERERREREAQATALDARLISVESKFLADHAAAQALLTDARKVLHFLRNETQHAAFVPGELDRLGEILDDACSALSRGLAQAAFGHCQTAIRGLARASGQIAESQARWNLLNATAQLRAKHLRDSLAVSSNLSLPLPTGGSYEVDVAFWSRGQFDQLSARSEHVLAELEGTPAALSLSRLEEILTEVLPAIQADMEKVVDQSHREVVRSQARYDIAAKMVAWYASQAFRVVDSRFVAEDVREAYVVKLADVDDNELVILVVSDESGTRAELHSFEGSPIEDRLRMARSQEMRTFFVEALGTNGVQVGPLKERASQPNAAFKETARIRVTDVQSVSG